MATVLSFLLGTFSQRPWRDFDSLKTRVIADRAQLSVKEKR